MTVPVYPNTNKPIKTHTLRITQYLLTAVLTLWMAGFTLALQAQEKQPITGIAWQAGQVRVDAQRWTEVIVGDMPLVISVPHGGAVHAEAIPDRDCREFGRVVKVTDSKTIQTARAIETAFLKKYNKRPYIIISHLSRRKVDQNREIDLATCGHPRAVEAWHSFHSSIDTALAHAVKAFGSAVYIDLHGHGHTNQRLELGYSLTKEDLQDAYADENVAVLAKGSSMQNYLKKHTEVTFNEILFGKTSFGTLIYKAGVSATPSSQDPHPVGDEAFFSGGYNTRRYTSADYPHVYGWQIEANYKGVRDTDDNRRAFGEAFVRAFSNFMNENPF